MPLHDMNVFGFKSGFGLLETFRSIVSLPSGHEEVRRLKAYEVTAKRQISFVSIGFGSCWPGLGTESDLLVNLGVFAD